MNLAKLALVAAGAGVAGWVIENTVAPPRNARLVPGLPFLPVYAAGGVAIALLAPHLQNQGPAARAVIYGSTLTGLEYATCKLDRATGGKTWDYGGGCIDLPHAALWAVMGLLAESAIATME